jgi:hypothetical protein
VSNGADDVLRVLLHQGQQAELLAAKQAVTARTADAAIASSAALLQRLGISMPTSAESSALPAEPLPKPSVRPWDVIAAEARASAPGIVTMADVLNPDEIASALREHDIIEQEFDLLHRLDAFDWAVAGLAGVLGALADVFLVQVPRHPGFFGGRAATGGWLSNAMQGGFSRVLPDDKIRALEDAFRVPYDASTSAGLGTPVPGLGPNTHRFQSLGHDPLLAWIVGIHDVLHGEFTAIGKNGQLITQVTGEPFALGERLYTRLFEALRLVAGHLISDVATPRGLPAPLMPLLLLLQTGKIGKHDYSVGELARQMYRSGYDFRHFLASSVPVLIIESLVRVAFFAKSLAEGAELPEAVPLANHPKLRTQLFIAHSVATAANAGKVWITQNPLALSWAQWLTFFRYLGPQLHWGLRERERQRSRHMESSLRDKWCATEAEHARLWRDVFGASEPVLL